MTSCHTGAILLAVEAEARLKCVAVLSASAWKQRSLLEGSVMSGVLCPACGCSLGMLLAVGATF